MRSSHPKKTRDGATGAGRVPLGAEPPRNNSENSQERAFLVGIDVRTRGRNARGTVTAQAQAARDAAYAAPSVGAKVQSSGQSSGQGSGQSTGKSIT
ncbi:MAG: hypothetical protein WAN17_18630, partial [Candidatus Sulfotelmatobacter sp.]